MPLTLDCSYLAFYKKLGYKNIWWNYIPLIDWISLNEHLWFCLALQHSLAIYSKIAQQLFDESLKETLIQKSRYMMSHHNHNKIEYTMDPWIYFLTKNNKLKIIITSTKNSLIRTYFLNYPLISRCKNLKMLSEYSSHDILLSHTI